jgi:putative polyhydroxyalkanoate system protein
MSVSTINVTQKHSLSKDEAKSRLSAFEEQLGKYGASLVWSGHEAKIKGMGVSGGATVADSSVNLTVKLGTMAKMAGVDAGKLEASIRKRLQAVYEDGVA